MRDFKRLTCTVALTLAVVLAGCKTTGTGAAAGQARSKAGQQPAIHAVRCLYNYRPWVSSDRTGDRDPEGIYYRVYLDPGTGKGVHVEGEFHVEMYRIDRSAGGVERILVSDWHYPTSRFRHIAEAGMLGDGYHFVLRWADKDTAGKEIEIVTRFEDLSGRQASSGTKRFRVPKYAS